MLKAYIGLCCCSVRLMIVLMLQQTTDCMGLKQTIYFPNVNFILTVIKLAIPPQPYTYQVIILYAMFSCCDGVVPG